VTSRPDLWRLARDNADLLRFSTLVKVRGVLRGLADDAGIDACIKWCYRHGVTRIYIETHRSERWAPRELLEHARDRFLAAGIEPAAEFATQAFGRRSNGWDQFVCFTSPRTREALKEMVRLSAAVFDEVMIDDFWCTDCTCPDCRRARGDRSWTEFRCAMMLELSRTHIIEVGKAVNPQARFIVKYPNWHEYYQDRGYDVVAQGELFPLTWAGTETRGDDTRPDWTGDYGDGREPQYRAYWLMRWLGGLGGSNCGGGWHDTMHTSPRFFVEQGRQTVLGGAREVLLCSYDSLSLGVRRRRGHGPDDMAALAGELPEHHALARLIEGREPRGLSGWKPPNSPAGADWDLHSLLGMAGFPVTAAHRFEPGALGYVFGYHVFHDPTWPDAAEEAMGSGKPIVATPTFARAARTFARGIRTGSETWTERLILLPELDGPINWPALEQMPREELDDLREAALAGTGISFSAPHGVSLHLFGDDVAVVESFRNDESRCRLRLKGWSGYSTALEIPRAAGARVAGKDTAEIGLPPRSLLALERSES
jgi:hypothetical protein